jgi:MotA/TolQ/ExbB proton channel family
LSLFAISARSRGGWSFGYCLKRGARLMGLEDIEYRNSKAARIELPAYRPFATLFGLGILLAGLFGAFSIQFPAVTVAVRSFFQHLDSQGPDGEPGFFGRIPNNTYTSMMSSLLVLLAIYSALQLYAVHRDYQNFKKGLDGTEPGYRFDLDWLLLALTGRPWRLYKAWNGKSGCRQQLAAHLQYGQMPLSMPMRLFLWAFPMLGFLGTAIGLSNAIRLLPDAMGKGGGTALEPVLRQLAFKFDTTILGIVSALLMMLLIQFYERSWENLEILVDAAEAPGLDGEDGAKS